MEAENIIIGGGLTGLFLAHEVEQKGGNYLLLEARDRLGGRVLSAPVVADPDARFDLGPAWVWPGQPRVAGLVQRFGLQVFPQYDQGRMVVQQADGRVRSDIDFSPMAGAMRIAGGVSTIIGALQSGVSEDRIRRAHRVERIQADGDGFVVAGRGPDGPFRARAKNNVVVALPPRVAAHTLSFEPALSPEAVQALRSIPTWMAGHAKVVAVYETPFWREEGLSGDGFSYLGPLSELHDASPASTGVGALFGFVSAPPGSPERDRETLVSASVEQLGVMFGPRALRPLDVIVKDWSKDSETATPDDGLPRSHPEYGPRPELSPYARRGLVFASTELSGQAGGLLEGALEAAENALPPLLWSREEVRAHG